MPNVTSTAKLKAIIDAAITDDEGNLLVLDSPSTSVLTPNIEEVITTGANRIGDQVIKSTYRSSFQPQMALTFPNFTFELLCMKLGFKPGTPGAVSGTVNNKLKVTNSNKSFGGVSSGQWGFGMVADQADSIAYYLGDDLISTMLTRQDFGTFNPATDFTFAQGANGAYIFSDNLVGYDVRYQFPNPVANGTPMSENSYTEFNLNMSFAMVNGAILAVEMPSVSLNLTDTDDIDFGASPTLLFRAVDTGVACQPIKIQYTGQLTACAA